MPSATTSRLVFVLVLAGALCAPARVALAQSSAPGPPPGVGARLLQGPADNLDDRRAREYIVDHLAPGTTISRRVGFSNGDARPIDLSFYAAAADIDDDAFAVGPGRAPNELTGWTTFSPASATVQPGQTLPVTLTIAVPADAVAGERYAAALAERSTPASEGGGVGMTSRVGIRIYLSIGPGGAPRTTFTIDSMTAKRTTDGNPLVTAKVHNTGQRAVDLSGRLDLSNGPSSLSAGPFAVRAVATLGPGESGDVAVPLEGPLPNGPWDAQITLSSGVTSVTGTARLTFPDAKGASATPATVVRPEPPPSRALVLAIAGGTVLTLFVLAVWARRRRRAHLPLHSARTLAQLSPRSRIAEVDVMDVHEPAPPRR